MSEAPTHSQWEWDSHRSFWAHCRAEGIRESGIIATMPGRTTSFWGGGGGGSAHDTIESPTSSMACPFPPPPPDSTHAGPTSERMAPGPRDVDATLWCTVYEDTVLCCPGVRFGFGGMGRGVDMDPGAGLRHRESSQQSPVGAVGAQSMTICRPEVGRRAGAPE